MHILRTEIARVAQPLRWASWVAVSSAPQAAEDKISIPHQRKLNQEHCDKHGGALSVELLVPGESRHIPTWEEACAELPAYAMLRDLIVRKQIDVLVYYDRTRLGRMASLIMTIEALCLRAGIALYETTNPPSEITAGYQYERSLVGAIGAVGAQQEVEKLKERRRIGMTNRIQRGEFAAQPNWGYYYKYDERGNRTVEIDQNAAHVVRMIYEKYLAGMGTIKLANWLNEQGYRTATGKAWNGNTINTIISAANIYAGYSEGFHHTKRGTPYVRGKGSWEPIITELQLRDALAERASRAKNRKLATTVYRFSGVCWCAECGNHYSGKNTQWRYRYVYMRCLRHKPINQIREEKIYAALEETIIKAGRGEMMLQSGDALEKSKAALADIERRRVDLERAYELADTAYINQRMTEDRYSAQVELLDARRRALDAEYSQAMGDFAAESLQGARSERMQDIAENGLKYLYSEDMAASNAWLRRTFRVWCRGDAVTFVEAIV